MAIEAPPAPPAPDIAPAAPDRGNVPAEPAGTHADSLGEAFDAMDKAFGEPPKEAAPPPPSKPAAETPPAKPGTPPKGPDGKFLPKEKAPADVKQPQKPAEPAVDKMAAPELRKAYGELRKKLAAIEEERAKAASAPPPEPQEDPEKHQLTQRLTEREKRLQEVEEELRYSAYERSAEYKEKFEQPFISAWKMGQDRAARLKIPDKRDELGDVTDKGRQGTPDDFNALMLIQDDGEAAEWATKMFGAQAPSLLYHREKVMEANIAKQAAIEQFKTQGSEREKQRAEMTENHTKAVRQLYHKTKDAAIEKYGQFFKPDPEDPKTAELLNKGMRLADRALGAPDEQGEKPLSMEERVKLQAAMRNCFGGFQNIAYQLQKERKARIEAEKRVSEYEASEPKGGDGRGGGRPAGGSEETETPESAFNQRFGT